MVSMKAPNDVLGEIIFDIAQKDDCLAIVYSDCAKRMNIDNLIDSFPEVCYETGISEQNQLALASAMAHEGFHVLAASYAPFITARALEYVRVNLGYMQAPVTLVGLSAGFAASDLGATHMALEDVAYIRTVPNVEIASPLDNQGLCRLLHSAIPDEKPTYIRLTNPAISPSNLCFPHEYDPRKALVWRPNVGFLDQDAKTTADYVFIAVGNMFEVSIEAARLLSGADDNISVCVCGLTYINPLNMNNIDLSSDTTVITVEEHSVHGGLGSSVEEYCMQKRIYCRIIKCGVPEGFYHADLPDELRASVGLTPERIATKIAEFNQE